MNSSLLASEGHRFSLLAYRVLHRGKRAHRRWRKSDPIRTVGQRLVRMLRMIPANMCACGRLFNASSTAQAWLYLLFCPHLDLLSEAWTMPSTVRPRASIKKALCVGIEYRELANKLPDLGLGLPAARADLVTMSGLLQGGSRTSVGVSQLRIIYGGGPRCLQNILGIGPRTSKS